MSNNNILHKSITDQILDEMFIKLRENDSFDNDSINKLEKLRTNFELNKLVKVHNAICSSPEENNEIN